MLYFSMYQVVQDENIDKILNKVKRLKKEETQPELKIGSIENEEKKINFSFEKSKQSQSI